MKKILTFAFLSLIITVVNGQDPVEVTTSKIDSLLNLSFDDLVNVSVITPTLNPLMSNQAPATVKVVSREQIRIRGYRNLAEVLNDLPDVTVHDKSDPQHYNRVSIRGVQRQDRFVILLDGIRISSPTNEPLPIVENFPIYLAKQIEVVYGPGSALYGADAMAGVINIITDKPVGNKSIVATATGGTHGYGNASIVYNQKIERDVHLTFAGQYAYDAQPDFSTIYKDQYSITSHETGVFNTAFGEVTSTQPVSPVFESPVKAYNMYAAIDKGGFNMKILHHYASVPSSTPLSPNNAVYNKDVFYGQGVTIGSASYTLDAGKLRSISTLVGSFYKVDPKSNFRNLYGGMKHGYKYSTGSMMKAEEQVHYSFSKKLNLVGGLAWELFESVPKTPELESPVGKDGAVSGILLNSTSKNNPNGIEARFFPINYTNLGSYIQVQYFPIQKLSFTGGVRYDHNSRFGSTINPRIGSVFNPLKNTTIKALYGTAFWAPSPMTTFESYGSFYTLDEGTTYRSSYWSLPNPDLKPMTSQTFEVSLEQKFKSFGVTISAYRTKIENMITVVPDNGNTDIYNNKFLGWEVDHIDVPFNKGTQENYGGNIALNSTFKIGSVDLNAYSSISFLQGSETALKSSDEEVEQGAITPVQFRLGIDGKIKPFYFSARLLKTGRQRMTDVRADDPNKRNTLEGYTLVNLSMGYTLKKNITFFMTVQNALDDRYHNSLGFNQVDAEGSFQNPIRSMVGVRATF
jgi:outer membrane cobalamin receptor